MKKKYDAPAVELITVSVQDVLTLSNEGGIDLPDDEFV
jgi:hypothetical protein